MGFNWADDHDSHEPLPPVFSEERLPPPQESFDPSTGIRTVTEFHLNDKGEKVKTIRQFKRVTHKLRINKNVPRRRRLEQFGDAYGATEADQKNVTYKAYDEIKLRLNAGGDDEVDEDDPLNKLSTQKSIVQCRLCGAVGDHWTLKCPKRNGPAQELARSGTAPAAGSFAAAAARGSSTGRYVAPSLRAGADRSRGAGSGDRDDMPTIRITNISEDTTEQDLEELLRPFGHVVRTRLAKDRVTNCSKGYAFISFSNRSDAQMAIDKLDGYGYDSLILRVEWSRSMQQVMREREEREAKEAEDASKLGCK